MISDKKYWLIVAASVLAAALAAICGCDLKGAATCRFADKIERWSLTATGRPDIVVVDGSGDPSLAANVFYAQYTSMGEPIESGGLSMDIKEFGAQYYTGYYYGGVYYPSPCLSYEFSGESDDNGVFEIVLKRNDWSWRDCYLHLASLSFKHPNKPELYSCTQAGYRSTADCTGERDLLAFYAIKQSNCIGRLETYYGGYYISGTQPISRAVAAKQSLSRFGICSAPDNPPAAPAYGIAKAMVRLVRDKADGGIAMASAMVASMTNDPNRLAVAKPYRFETVVRCAEPIEAAGAKVVGVCKVKQPDGTTLAYEMSSVVEQDGEYLAMRSGGIITVEPYCWTTKGQSVPNPYWIADKLIVPVKLNYMGGPGTTIEYEITDVDRASLVPILAKYWLTNNKTLDKNHDGIVSFLDM